MDILSLNIAGVFAATLLNQFNLKKIIKLIIITLITIFYGVTLISSNTLISNYNGLFCMLIILVTMLSNTFDEKNNFSSQIVFLPMILFFPELWQKFFILICFYINKGRCNIGLNLTVLMLILSLSKIGQVFTSYITIFEITICSYLIYSKFISKDTGIIDKLVVIFSLINVLSLLGNTVIVNIIVGIVAIKIIFDKGIIVNYNLLAFFILSYFVQLKYISLGQFIMPITTLLVLVTLSFDRSANFIPNKYITKLNTVVCISLLSLFILIATERYEFIIFNIIFAVFGFLYFLKVQNEIFEKTEIVHRTLLMLVLCMLSIIGFVI
jgi:hypothetical protein